MTTIAITTPNITILFSSISFNLTLYVTFKNLKFLVFEFDLNSTPNLITAKNMNPIVNRINEK